MNKICSKCSKIVYPTEELKCLDKLWHKQCFKCQICNMTLNMRTYKGFNKNPYCEAHIPKAKATTVAETPELRRLAENTKIQSNVKYHAEFEKTKGKLTQIADDPETLRVRQNSQIISNVAYHGDLKKKAEMEQRRILTNENELPNNSTGYAYCRPNVIVEPPAANSNTISNNFGPLPNNNSDGTATQIGITNLPQQQKLTSGLVGNVYRAMYDYEARESDEVSFLDGDIILNCFHIHEGWMSGIVQRTGEYGLLPANYVESVII